MDNSTTGPHDRASWPAWATEAVRIAPPDPAYPALARAYAAELADLLDGVAHGPVEHVGSTAVPGLVAKPVVDLVAVLDDPARWCTDHLGALTTRAWHLVPPELDTTGRERRLLVRVDPDGRHRLAHLHLLWPGSPRLAELLAFRDALVADPDLAAEYAGLEQAGAVAHHDDREAYTASKAEFVSRVLSRRDATG